MVVCPYCQRTDFKNQHGLSIHIGRMHKGGSGSGRTSNPAPRSQGTSYGFNSDETTCPICNRGGFKGQHGLSIHIGRMHPGRGTAPDRHVAFGDPFGYGDYNRGQNQQMCGRPSPSLGCSEETTCPICYRGGFKGERGLNIHIGRMHPEARGRRPVAAAPDVSSSYQSGPAACAYGGPPSLPSSDETTCPFCNRGGFNGERGLMIHIGRMHPEGKAQPVAAAPEIPDDTYDDAYEDRSHVKPIPKPQNRKAVSSTKKQEPKARLPHERSQISERSREEWFAEQEPEEDTASESEDDFDSSDDEREFLATVSSPARKVTQTPSRRYVPLSQELVESDRPTLLTAATNTTMQKWRIDSQTLSPRIQDDMPGPEFQAEPRIGETASGPSLMVTPSSPYDEAGLPGVNDHHHLIQFSLDPDQTSVLKLAGAVEQVVLIDVHRGLACRDLMAFFQKEENAYSEMVKYKVRMLKPNGTEEEADDDGGVTRDALSEFWETFYVQYTIGNAYKVPCLRHDMMESHWEAVAMVLLMGFKQEGIFPIKLAPPFMERALFGESTDIIQPFMRYVADMDREVLEMAMNDWDSVEEEDLEELQDRYEIKKELREDNIEEIIQELGHKEMVQKPSFVAETWRDWLTGLRLNNDELLDIYTKLQPNARKVLKTLVFPRGMNEEESKLSKHLQRLIREFDAEVLGLFLRFCTSSDLMVKEEITVIFMQADTSDTVRSPRSRTCGAELILPISYGKDAYVALKSDFVTLLKAKFWEMDLA